jgi:hypothetical protein
MQQSRNLKKMNIYAPPYGHWFETAPASPPAEDSGDEPGLSDGLGANAMSYFKNGKSRPSSSPSRKHRPGEDG